MTSLILQILQNCRQLGWMILQESKVKVLISSNSYPLGELAIAILWKCFHYTKIKRKIFQSWFKYQNQSVACISCQWYNLTFWTLTQSGKWNKAFWDFQSVRRKSTCQTIFRKVLFAIVLSHFQMLEVLYAYTEEYNHSDCFLKTEQIFAICTK